MVKPAEDEYASSAAFYDHVVPYRERPDVPFYVQMAREAGGPVLELGCGTGRVLIPTARAGVEITGLDSSPAMLALCRDKLAQEPGEVRSRVTLVKGDMRDFDVGTKKFALATTPFRPFQHLVTVEEQLGCLSAVRRHLVDGGKFILDVFNPSLQRLVDDRYRQEVAEDEFTLPDGRRVLRKNRVVSTDFFNQVLDIENPYYVTDAEGRQERYVHRFLMRYLFRFEGEHLLARAGFEVEAVYADYQKTPYGQKQPPGELVFMARKV